MLANHPVFSSRSQLLSICTTLRNYSFLPFASSGIPGAIMEAVLAHVRGASVRQTYEFIDVLDSINRIAWQVKSTKFDTPLTWKRAKITDSSTLITQSENDPHKQQLLGDMIIDFCNGNIMESMENHNLDAIGYSRLIIHKDGLVEYFERLLCTSAMPYVFDKRQFVWEWGFEYPEGKKERLRSLQGRDITTGDKWWSWHGRGENQLHFNGERFWWPSNGGHGQSVRFRRPSFTERMGFTDFNGLFSNIPFELYG